MAIHFGGITHSLGEAREIGELDPLREDPKRLERFLRMGFRHYRRSGATAVELAFDCAKRTLEATGVRGASVDAILYCTETFGEPDFYHSLSRACQALGLDAAFQIGISLTGCGNFSSGLKTGASLIASGGFRRVLLLCADRAAQGPASRLMEPGVGIVSDGAAGCLLSEDATLPYRLLHVELLAKNAMGTLDPARDFMKYNMESFEGRRDVFSRTYAKLGAAPADVALLVTNNYGSNTMKGFASESGVGMDRIFAGNVAANGHVSAADNLINLEACRDRLPAGGLALMLSTGPFSWGLAAIRAAGAMGAP